MTIYAPYFNGNVVLPIKYFLNLITANCTDEYKSHYYLKE